MTISEVQIVPVKPQGGLVAFASCVINGQLYLGNIAIHTRPTGNEYRLVFPTKVLPNGKLIQCFHPVTHEAGELLLKEIASKFEALIASSRCAENVAAMSRKPGGQNEDGSRVP